MRAMIMAAGRGGRMQHLTQNKPKALLKVAGNYLIHYPLRALSKIGITEIVINISHEREQIKSAIGDGKNYGVKIYYSEEEEPLETGGGIYKALPLLGKDPFIVVSCDVITDYPLQKLPRIPDKLAHIVLVDNPSFHPHGDFGLEGTKLYLQAEKKFTFGNIGIYRPELFAQCKPEKFRLGDLLKTAIEQTTITGEHYQGFWHNLGTPEQLQSIVAVPDSLL